jgi:hypothetical protein
MVAINTDKALHRASRTDGEESGVTGPSERVN